MGFSHHTVDLASEVCRSDKPLVFVLDVKPSKEVKEDDKRAPKRQKKEKKASGKKDKKTKVSF